ncbi:MAG: hypothetical protein AAGE01_21175 [Pseudomonadota bacterium]
MNFAQVDVMRARWTLLLLPIALLAVATSTAEELNESDLRALEKAADIIQKGSENSPDFSLNTVPEGCLSNPLPLTPVGPTATLEIEGFMDSAELTIWRAPCRPDNSAIMVTVTPLEGEMFVCSSRVQITQLGVDYDTARLVRDVETGDRLCADVTEPVTVVIDQPPEVLTFDQNLGFDLLYRGSENVAVSVEHYRPEDFFAPEDFEKQVLRPELGGAWFEPDAPGQGFQFNFADRQGELVLVVFWYAFEDGQQRYFFGEQVVTAGQREIEVPLMTSTGADFGEAFDPDDVVLEDWGTLFLSFTNCNQGEARYVRTSDGAEGTLNIERLINLAGLICRELP